MGTFHTIMFIPAVVLALFLSSANAHMLLAISDTRRSFYHSIRDTALTEDVDLSSGFRFGECSYLFNGRIIKVGFYAGRFYPHYEVSSGDSRYLSDEEAYKACVRGYKSLSSEVLYDIGLTALALADFAYELGMADDLSPVPALEFLINFAKKSIDRTDEKRLLASGTSAFAEETLKFGGGNSENVHFRGPADPIYREPKDFLNRPVEDLYSVPSNPLHESIVRNEGGGSRLLQKGLRDSRDRLDVQRPREFVASGPGNSKDISDQQERDSVPSRPENTRDRLDAQKLRDSVPSKPGNSKDRFDVQQERDFASSKPGNAKDRYEVHQERDSASLRQVNERERHDAQRERAFASSRQVSDRDTHEVQRERDSSVEVFARNSPNVQLEDSASSRLIGAKEGRLNEKEKEFAASQPGEDSQQGKTDG